MLDTGPAELCLTHLGMFIIDEFETTGEDGVKRRAEGQEAVRPFLHADPSPLQLMGFAADLSKDRWRRRIRYVSKA